VRSGRPAAGDGREGVRTDQEALTSERLKTTFLGQGATPFWLDPTAAGDFRRTEEQKLAPIIKASGAQVG
jgi:hypothetical protein